MQASSAGKPAQAIIDRRELCAALRAQVLAIKPADVGAARASGLFGAMIEMAFADAVVSLAALIDGSVSVYVSDGSGCVGCGVHADVRAAANDLFSAADTLLTVAPLAPSLSAPQPEYARAFLLTTTGVRLLQAPLTEAQRGSFGALYTAGLHVLQTVERTRAGHSLQTEIDAATVPRAATAAANENEPCLSVGNAVRRLRS
jgi:hypothetical protein